MESANHSDSSGLESMAKIYGKSGKPLTTYQKAMNDAAIDLARNDPSLVYNKGVFFNSYWDGAIVTHSLSSKLPVNKLIEIETTV